MSEVRVYDKDETAEVRRRMRRDPLFTNPSEPRWWQDRLMQREIDRLIVIANGAVMSYQPRITAKQSDSAPPTDLLTRADHYAERYDEAETHERRLFIIKRVQDAVSRLRYSKRLHASAMRHTAEWRAAIGNDTRPYRTIALEYSVSLDTVRRYQKQAGNVRQRGRRANVRIDSVSTVAP